jgi:hypothetical protein
MFVSVLSQVLDFQRHMSLSLLAEMLTIILYTVFSYCFLFADVLTVNTMWWLHLRKEYVNLNLSVMKSLLPWSLSVVPTFYLHETYEWLNISEPTELANND